MLKISREDILKLAEVVRHETGNAVQEKNFSMLESRLRTHLTKAGIESMTEYWDYFKQNEISEREVLQGLMTTHYTFFFREFTHFEHLDSWINAQIGRLKERYAKTQAPVRVWSAASSRGQEVYSLAMFLDVHLFKKHGIPYEVVGTDIDQGSVNYGRNGVYPIKEVNSIPHQYLNGYWKKGTGQVKEFAAVRPELKQRVHFEAANLLKLDSFKNQSSFDVIFCRNVLIYFTAENVKQIVLDLARHLDPDGLFVSGLSEPIRFDGWNFESTGPSCYQKIKSKSVATVAAPKASENKNIAPARYRVLCVDDSPTIQKLMQKIFSQDPMCEKVETAENGLVAHNKLKSSHYDLITLDIHMPEVNGIEFLEKFYQKKTHPPVIMVSSVNRADLDLATKSISLGAFDYVEKPAMNNLQKSAEEILTKAKLAIRTGGQHAVEKSLTDFDEAIAHKIVVPDASLCLRVIFASSSSQNQLKQIIKAQEQEVRSPATIIVWKDADKRRDIDNSLTEWTPRQIHPLREKKSYLKPNVIYVADIDSVEGFLTELKTPTASVQILDFKGLSRGLIPSAANLQILVDETLQDSSGQIENLTGKKISDISPATSFASLSVEFFANLRSKAA